MGFWYREMRAWPENGQAATRCEVGESVPAIDIVVRWGDWVLAAKELSPPRTFSVGESLSCDVVLPKEAVGVASLPVILARWDGEVRLVVPNGARVLLDGQGKRMSAARVIAKGKAVASKIVPDAAEIELGLGRNATLFLGPIEIDVTCSEAAQRLPRKPPLELRLGLTHLLSAVMHFGLGFVVATTMPIDIDEDGTGVTDDQKFYIQQMLNAAAEKEEEGSYAEQRAGYEHRARRNERRNRAYLEAIARQEWLDSLLGGSRGWSGKTIAEAQAESERDPDAQSQELFGGFYERPALPKPMPAALAEPPRGSALPAAPTLVRYGAMTVSGRLPPEVIQRIVRQNFGRFRLCYERGLRMNPNLQGRVSVRFVIGRDGAVSNVGNGGSDMPDGSVVSCIVRSFDALTFPQPEGGIVTVVYPINFSPGG